jgi:hypothetical protein
MTLFRDLNSRILAKAISVAIAVFDGLPDDKRAKQANDRDDMVHILHLMIPDPVDRERLALEAEALTGRLPDLTDWTLRE